MRLHSSLDLVAQRRDALFEHPAIESAIVVVDLERIASRADAVIVPQLFDELRDPDSRSSFTQQLLRFVSECPIYLRVVLVEAFEPCGHLVRRRNDYRRIRQTMLFLLVTPLRLSEERESRCGNAEAHGAILRNGFAIG